MRLVDVGSSAQLFHDNAGSIGGVGTRTENMRLHPALDQPAGVPAAQIFIVDDPHRSRPAPDEIFRQLPPHCRTHDRMRVGIVDSKTVDHWKLLGRLTLRLYVSPQTASILGAFRTCNSCFCAV